MKRMVKVMETWFMADKLALEQYFGNGFNVNSLPKRANIEEIPKHDVVDAIRVSAKGTTKKEYDKGRDSFYILSSIDPSSVIAKSGWASRFVTLLSEKMNG